MKRFKKLACLLMAMALSAALFAGCGKGDGAQGEQAGMEGKISISGSSALLPLLKPAQEELQTLNPRLKINISGGGSFTGINQVSQGAVNIGSSDVEIPEEYAGMDLVDHKIVVEPFVFITDKANPVDNISKEQAVAILAGRITNWQAIGGPDQQITLIHRAKSSGSRAAISEVVLQGENFTNNAIIQDSNGAVRSAVSKTPGAIGYVDAPYADASVKILSFNGISYTPQAVIEGKYPVYGYGHLYTKGEAKGEVKAFIDYVMSEDFQSKQVEKLGFIPIAKMKDK